MRMLLVLFGMISAAALFGCSDGSSSAPAADAAHPAGWIGTHGAEAAMSPNHAACAVCHGSDLRGSGDIVSCYECHSYNMAPPLKIHPPGWAEPYSDHRLYAAINGFDSCVPCHGQDLRGGEAAPSCLSPSFNGAACHVNGPGGLPHPIDGIYLDGLIHGFDAKAGLTSCQACHGQLGGPGSNPRFNIGIFKAGGVGCEGCHNDGTAHPSAGGRDARPWYDGTYRHGDAQGFDTQCTLCHGTNLEGGSGPACTFCHIANPAGYQSGCLSCHSTPPNGSGVASVARPNRSGAHGRVGHKLACTFCHAGATAGTAEHFDTTPPATINFSLGTAGTLTSASNGANTTCTGTCHFREHYEFPWYNE